MTISTVVLEALIFTAELCIIMEAVNCTISEVVESGRYITFSDLQSAIMPLQPVALTSPSSQKA